MGRMTNEEVLKMARRAAAHVAAGVEAVEISAPALEKAMWELLLLRKREADAREAKATVLSGNVPQHIDPSRDKVEAISCRTMPGTIKAIRERRDSERFSLPGDEQ